MIHFPHRSDVLRTFLPAMLAVAPFALPQGKPASRPAQQPDRAPQDVVKEATSDKGVQSEFDKRLLAGGIAVDRAAKMIAIRGQFNAPKQPLEYLITAPHGPHYESLIAIQAKPSDVAAALLSLGVGVGQAPRRHLRSQDPDAAKAASAPADGGPTFPYIVDPGSGDGVFIYIEWNDDRGFHRHRVEDLVFERPEGRTIKNSKFIFSNSIMLEPRSSREVLTYAANADGNFASCGFGGSPVLAYPKPHPMAMEGEYEIYQPNWTLVPSEPTELTLILSSAELVQPVMPSMAPPPAQSKPAPSPAPAEGSGK